MQSETFRNVEEEKKNESDSKNETTPADDLEDFTTNWDE